MNPFQLLLVRTLVLAACLAAVCSAYGQPPADARKIDEYGQVVSNNEKARLDYVVMQFHNSPDARMYVVVSGETPAIVKARAYRVSDYATRVRGLDRSRLVVITWRGKLEPNTQIWFVPPGATPPR